MKTQEPFVLTAPRSFLLSSSYANTQSSEYSSPVLPNLHNSENKCKQKSEDNVPFPQLAVLLVSWFQKKKLEGGQCFQLIPTRICMTEDET